MPDALVHRPVALQDRAFALLRLRLNRVVLLLSRTPAEDPVAPERQRVSQLV